jgi:hypothetical protein
MTQVRGNALGTTRSTPVFRARCVPKYTRRMPDYQFTPYFENQVLRKRSYLTKDMCIRVLRSPIRSELQGNDRYRFWGRVDELGGRFLRVITLSDKLTIHNAFLDRRFRP